MWDEECISDDNQSDLKERRRLHLMKLKAGRTRSVRRKKGKQKKTHR